MVVTVPASTIHSHSICCCSSKQSNPPMHVLTIVYITRFFAGTLITMLIGKVQILICVIIALTRVNVISLGIANSQSQLYVIPNTNSACLEESCYTLGYLANNQHILSTFDNITLIFYEGFHTINSTINRPLIFSDKASIQILAKGNFAHILCQNSGSQFGFVFTQVDRVTMMGITLNSCSGTSIQGTTAGTIIFHMTNVICVENIIVTDSSCLGISATQAYGNTTFDNITLGSNKHGNMKFVWNKNESDCESLNGSFVSLSIKHSFLINGGAVVNQSLTESGGLSLQIINQQCLESDFLILNTHMIDNSGYRGGNMGITVSGFVRGTIVKASIRNSVFEGGRAIIGGGIGFIMESMNNLCYDVQNESLLLVINSTIENNHADRDVGGLLLQTVNVCQDTLVQINDTHFINNSVAVDNQKADSLYSGGAILFYIVTSTLLWYPQFNIVHSMFKNNSAGYGGGLSFIVMDRSSTIRQCTQVSHMPPIFLIEGSIFEENRAIHAGGLSIMFNGSTGYINTIQIQNITFVGNKAQLSCSAMCVTSTLQSSPTHLTMNGIRFTDNALNTQTECETVGTIVIININKVLFSDCMFQQNNASAILALHSGLVFHGRGTFAMNHGINGGAMALYATTVHLYANTSLLFTNNSAKQKGGALYIHDKSYLPTNVWENHCPNLFQKISDLSNESDPRLEFYGNTAEIAGDVLYGGSIEQCTIVQSFFYYEDQTGLSVLTSDPTQVCICNSLNEIMCNGHVLEINTLSGVPFALSVSAFGLGNGLTPAIVQVQNQGTLVQNHSFIYQIHAQCTNLMYTVHSRERLEILHLYLINRYKSSNPVVVKVNLSDCPLGFLLTGYPPKCQCYQKLFDNNIHCNSTDFTITRHGSAWIGIFSCHNCTDQLVIHKYCPLDYCKQGIITLTESDHLCTHGRTGLLCSQCQTNLSITFGGNTCKACSNDNLALLVVFMIAGPLLIFVLTSVNLTVTEGAINGLIFFAGAVHVNKAAFFQPGESNVLTVFLSWVNLDFGFQVCFYDGMNVYEKTWLQFIFPVYVVAIAVLIIVASEYSQTVQRLTRVKTRINVMCTLFLLVYLKVLRTVTMALSYTYVNHANSTMTVWLYDGTPYMSRKHIGLLSVSVAIITLIALPYTAMLLFSQWLQRLPYFKSQWALKFVSIMEAYSGPYKFKYRFWIGLLLLTYTILMVIFLTTGGEYYTNLTAIAVCSCLLVLIKTICGGVYKKSLHDITESFYLLNLCILSITVLFARQASREDYQASTYMFASIALIVSLLVLITHIYNASSHLQKCWKHVKSSNIISRLRTTESLYRFLESDDENSEHELQSHYHEPSHLAIALNDLESEDKVPDNWIPTNYPTPVFREDPTLLCESVADNQPVITHPEPHEDSHTESSSARTSETVQSVVLIVDRNEDEAILVEDPDNEPIRSKFTSFDKDGNTSTIIEDITYSSQKSNTFHKLEHQSMTSYLQRQSNSQPMFSIPEETNIASPSSTNDSPDTDATGQRSDTGVKSDRSVDAYLCSSGSEALIPRYPHIHTTAHKQARKIQKDWNRRKMSKHIFPTKSSKMFKKTQNCDPNTAKNSVYCQCISLELLTDPLHSFTVTSKGKTFTCLDHDITIKVPSGAIHGRDQVEIEVGILLHGPFAFPDGIKPISPILWVCAKPEIKFQKPMEITLPHVLSSLTEKESKIYGVTFLKANHRAFIFKQGSSSKYFQFNSYGGDTKSIFNSNQGTLSTDHFCFLCIGAESSQQLYQRASYCITRIEPKPWPAQNPETTIYFCISYFLTTCIKVFNITDTRFCAFITCFFSQAIKQQCSDQQEIKQYQRFNFITANDGRERICIEISCPSQEWHVIVESPLNKEVHEIKSFYSYVLCYSVYVHMQIS